MASPKLTVRIADELQKLHDTLYRLEQLAEAAKQEAIPAPTRLEFVDAVQSLQSADVALRETDLVLDAYRDESDQLYGAVTVGYATPLVETR